MNREAGSEAGTRKMKVHSIVGVEDFGFAMLNLIEEGGGRIVTINIGIFEAKAIMMGLVKLTAERPMTHDLIMGMVDALGKSIEKVVITKNFRTMHFMPKSISPGKAADGSLTQGQAIPLRWP